MPENEEKIKGVSWTIREFRKEHTPWKAVIVLSLFSVAVGALLVFLQNYFGAAFFFLIPIFGLIALLRDPRMLQCALSEKGITVNRTEYRYKRLAYFDIREGELIIKRKKGGAVHIPIHEGDEDIVEQELSKVLPREEHEDGFMELVARMVKMR
jgi:hypothetical protein